MVIDYLGKKTTGFGAFIKKKKKVNRHSREKN